MLINSKLWKIDGIVLHQVGFFPADQKRRRGATSMLKIFEGNWILQIPEQYYKRQVPHDGPASSLAIFLAHVLGNTSFHHDLTLLVEREEWYVLASKERLEWSTQTYNPIDYSIVLDTPNSKKSQERCKKAHQASR
jgi:hypothetical protein